MRKTKEELERRNTELKGKAEQIEVMVKYLRSALQVMKK